MRKYLPEAVSGFVQLNHRRRQWHKAVTALACIVVFCTTYALILPAITMTENTFCGMEEHSHTDECYEKRLVCPLEEGAPETNAHEHGEACYTAERVLSCGQEPRPAHLHTDECLDETGALICGLAEDAGHEHTEDCYREERVLICTLDGGEGPSGHQHGDECYETTLICEKEEHQHSLICYSDPEADVESSIVWERTLPHTLSGSWRADLAAVAESQVGYLESIYNYTVDDAGMIHGYTRYGDWYGDRYGDWSGMFVSFCISYAGAPYPSLPYGADCARWADVMNNAGLYVSAWLHAPQCGDIVFLNTDGDGWIDHAGIVTATGYDETYGEYLFAVVGDLDGAAALTRYDLNGGAVLGYGVLPEDADGGEPDDPNGEADTGAQETLCGYEEHFHSEACYAWDGTLVCERTEHIHGASCFAPVGGDARDFTYEDSELSLLFHVESDVPLLADAGVAVTPLDESSAEYHAFAGYAQSAGADGGTEQWVLRRVALVQNGTELDASAYRMSAEIAVKQSVLAPLAQELSAITGAAPETELGITLSVMQSDTAQNVSELESVMLAPNESAPTFSVAVQNGTIALLASTTANPHYKVQYYAYIPRFSESGDKELTVFDTSGGVLPGNGTAPAERKLHLELSGGTTGKNAGAATPLYRVATTDTLTQMYSANDFEYIKAPNPSYINKLIDNPSYTLREIWVLKSGKDPESTSRDDWNVYGTGIHFTNRAESAAGNVICIQDDTVIRLVYNTNTTSFTTPAAFYDYDISSGQNADGKWRTGITGINQAGNYGSSRNGQRNWDSHCDVLAFGNANTGTGMSAYQFDSIYLNRYSGKNYGCTFGLVDSLDDNGNIVYNPWLVAPKLFSDGSAKGKHTYDSNSGSSLTFSRVGDTYTLSSATVGGGLGTITQLDQFFNPSPKTDGTVYDSIFTNDFWPLDRATDKTDPLFGSYSSPKYYQGFYDWNGSWRDYGNYLPYSDDGQEHNSYFGMEYGVTFDLAADYVGPLEYTFFGDDDMWVFLDGRLVCDIGGVHSSVGEYVNLWDYLRNADGTPKIGTHTLKFFYTERGASGSTCYMNFTLPSVSGVNIEQKTGDLKISKEVVGDSPEGRQFAFDIRFQDQNGNEILDDYAYTKYRSDGTAVENDLVLHDGSSFELAAGEYIIIKYLPIGLRYTVQETGASSDGYTVTNTVNGIVSSGASASGTIIKGLRGEVTFTNTRGSVGLMLQKLGQDGTPLGGATFTLKDAAGNYVNFIDNGDGAYTVPDSAADLIEDHGIYYIASSINRNYVIGQDTGSSTFDARLQLKTGADAQKFRVYRQADGSYSFQCLANGKWLDLDNGMTENYHLVHFWENASTPTAHVNQKWHLLVNSDGTFRIKPRVAVLEQSSAVLDLNGANAAQGERIQVYADNGSGAQQWVLLPAGEQSAPATTTELTVGESGLLTLQNLIPDTYWLEEIRAPEGCIRLSGPIRIHVDGAGRITLPDGANDLLSVEEAGSGMILKVKNRYTDRSLTLQKRVEGSSTTQPFTFEILWDGRQEPLEISLANGDAYATGACIPYGASVTITETGSAGFTVRFLLGDAVLDSDSGSVTFIMTDDITITAVNTASYALPSTGGDGIDRFIAGGALLAAGSLLWGLRARRRRERGVD